MKMATIRDFRISVPGLQKLLARLVADNRAEVNH